MGPGRTRVEALLRSGALTQKESERLLKAIDYAERWPEVSPGGFHSNLASFFFFKRPAQFDLVKVLLLENRADLLVALRLFKRVIVFHFSFLVLLVIVLQASLYFLGVDRFYSFMNSLILAALVLPGYSVTPVVLYFYFRRQLIAFDKLVRTGGMDGENP